MSKARTKQKAKRGGKNRLRIRKAFVFGPKDIDQIKKQVESPVEAEYDPDLPGCGEFYCCECDRHFISAGVLADHRRSGPHKRRARELRDTPHSQKDAEWAVGLT